MQQVEIRLYMYTWDSVFNGTKGVSEKNDCVGSFFEPQVELVLSLDCRSASFFGEVVGTEGGEDACLFGAAEVERAWVRSMTMVVGVLSGARTEINCWFLDMRARPIVLLNGSDCYERM